MKNENDSLLTTHDWEFKAYEDGRDYRSYGGVVNYPSNQSIMNHISNNYATADMPFAPYVNI